MFIYFSYSIDSSKQSTSTVNPSDNVEQSVISGGQKRPYSSTESTSSTLQKTTQGGRSRLFIGNIPSDLTQEEFQSFFGKYGELIEYYVNPSRGFGFVKLVCSFDLNRKREDFIFLNRAQDIMLNKQNMNLMVLYYVVNQYVYVLQVKVQLLKLKI